MRLGEGGGVENVCGCTPTSCAAEVKNCDIFDIGCGDTELCGNCDDLVGQDCGVNEANVCGCVPLTCDGATGTECDCFNAFGTVENIGECTVCKLQDLGRGSLTCADQGMVQHDNWGDYSSNTCGTNDPYTYIDVCDHEPSPFLTRNSCTAVGTGWSNTPDECLYTLIGTNIDTVDNQGTKCDATNICTLYCTAKEYFKDNGTECFTNHKGAYCAYPYSYDDTCKVNITHYGCK